MSFKKQRISSFDIFAPVIDYAVDYPQRTGKVLCHLSYEQLKTGKAEIKGKEVSIGSISSYAMALEIAEKLKKEIEQGSFLLSAPSSPLPVKKSMKPMKEKGEQG